MEVAEKKFTKEDVSNILRDYRWMMNEIKRITEMLNDTEQSLSTQYGEEAALPKGKNKYPDTIVFEVNRRLRKDRRMRKLLRKVEYIQQNMHKITDEKQKIVLDCLLDGMNIAEIARHMNVSRKHIHELKNQIVEAIMR